MGVAGQREDGQQRAGIAPGANLALLNGLRGIAALAILFWHYQHFFYPLGARDAPVGFTAHLPASGLFWPLYDHGHFAVQVFWILSGVVFAHVYLPAGARGYDFAVSRFARLYPLYLVTLLAIAALQLVALQRFGTTLIYGPGGATAFIQHLAMMSG